MFTVSEEDEVTKIYFKIKPKTNEGKGTMRDKEGEYITTKEKSLERKKYSKYVCTWYSNR